MSKLLQSTTGLKNFVCYNNGLSAKMNPLVPINILDSFMRRPDGEARAVGCLMGIMSEGNILEITDSFTIVHSDRKEGVALEIDYHAKMVKLRTAVHPKESVIGWYSVGDQDEFSDDNIQQTVTLQQFFKGKESMFTSSQQFVNPVYLNINTAVENNGQLDISLFTSVATPVCQDLMQFVEVPIRSESFGLERSVLDLVLMARSEEQTTGKTPYLSEVDPLKNNVDELLAFFKKAQEYTGSVLSGKAEGNAEVGRALSRAMCNDADLDETKFDSLINGATKDTLMVMYLSQLARTQIVLGEQINQVLAAEQKEQ